MAFDVAFNAMSVFDEDGKEIPIAFMKGDKGDTGETGQVGPAGQDGITPRLGIGRVETLAPESPAMAEITGPVDALKLNLGIPQGKPGEGGGSGGGEKPWRLIASADLDGSWPNVTFDTDIDGRPFKLRDVLIIVDGGVQGKKWVGINGKKDAGSAWPRYCQFEGIVTGVTLRFETFSENVRFFAGDFYAGKVAAEKIYFESASAANGHLDIYGRDL